MHAIGEQLQNILPPERIKTRLIDLVAYAADAGFYYLRPLAVVLPVSEQEVVDLFKFSHRHQIPMVFRTAGTSLSGQAVTDGILVDLSQYWNKIIVENNGAEVRVQPGAIGAHVNAALKKYAAKIGPDPASINSAMMGGILSNNSSGMCCGVSKNSYHTTRHIRFILPNGLTFFTGNEADYIRFETDCPDIYNKLNQLRSRLLEDTEAVDLIRRKYLTKNTVGYSVNAFIDFEHPLDILAHLLIGAEGTLGFIAEAVLKTVPDHPAKATAMLYFADMSTACNAIPSLIASGAEAVELMDRAALRSIEHIAGMPAIIQHLPLHAAALLVEYQAHSAIEVDAKVNSFNLMASGLQLLEPAVFTGIPAQQALLWKVRKGMFPSVGAVRASGTTVILEDIAFPVETLGAAITDLQKLFVTYKYNNAIIFGHAKDGNIHFVVTQAFDTPAEVERYDAFLREVVNLVVLKYNGTLKAEHGTGRNMAPFVETEWGGLIYQIMKEVKELIDPQNLLNPGVIINSDKTAHIKNLKDLPRVEEEVDRCMECGFCEHKCPSRNITLTPRKRIVVRRELLKLKNTGNNSQYKKLLNQYQYDGLDTCAVDGLCATACPVDINTGDLVKRLRRESHSGMANRLAVFTAKNFGPVTGLVRFALKSGVVLNRSFGANSMRKLTGAVKRVLPAFPLWSNQLAVAPALPVKRVHTSAKNSVVYFPTCISRVMGEPDQSHKPVMQTFFDVSEKANINVIIPHNIGKYCCGQIYSSKGFKDGFAVMANETVSILWETTLHGQLPVVLDISSCTQTLQHCRPVLSAVNKERFDALKIIDSIDYLHDHVMANVTVARKKEAIVLHPVCSLQKMPGTEDKLHKVAAHFAHKVTSPFNAGCCGMAGDRGFLHPELTKSATSDEAGEVKHVGCDGYYSSSKTCEIAMSDAVGKNYLSILNLVDDCI